MEIFSAMEYCFVWSSALWVFIEFLDLYPSYPVPYGKSSKKSDTWHLKENKLGERYEQWKSYHDFEKH